MHPVQFTHSSGQTSPPWIQRAGRQCLPATNQGTIDGRISHMQKLKTLDSKEQFFTTKKKYSSCFWLKKFVKGPIIDASNFLPSQICGTKCTQIWSHGLLQLIHLFVPSAFPSPKLATFQDPWATSCCLVPDACHMMPPQEVPWNWRWKVWWEKWRALQ